MFGVYSNRFFTVNLHADELTAEQQFGISLGQILGQLSQRHNNTLYANGIKKFKRDLMKNCWDITDKVSAHQVLRYYLQKGDRGYYNRIVDKFLETRDINGKLKEHAYDQHYYTKSFKYINQVLKMRGAKQWFSQPGKDFLVKCDAFDIGRMVYVCRICYSLDYITEQEAWDYIDKYAALARKHFTNWEDYAKSYLLGRAVWAGNSYVDFDEFFKITKRLVNSKNSPWVKFGW